jgi:hypothetical protein
VISGNSFEPLEHLGSLFGADAFEFYCRHSHLPQPFKHSEAQNQQENCHSFLARVFLRDRHPAFWLQLPCRTMPV